MIASKADLEAASKYISNGGFDKLPLDQLRWFMTVTRAMADMCEAEMKRRSVSSNR